MRAAYVTCIPNTLYHTVLASSQAPAGPLCHSVTPGLYGMQRMPSCNLQFMHCILQRELPAGTLTT